MGRVTVAARSTGLLRGSLFKGETTWTTTGPGDGASTGGSSETRISRSSISHSASPWPTQAPTRTRASSSFRSSGHRGWTTSTWSSVKCSRDTRSPSRSTTSRPTPSTDLTDRYSSATRGLKCTRRTTWRKRNFKLNVEYWKNIHQRFILIFGLYCSCNFKCHYLVF